MLLLFVNIRKNPGSRPSACWTQRVSFFIGPRFYAIDATGMCCWIFEECAYVAVHFGRNDEEKKATIVMMTEQENFFLQTSGFFLQLIQSYYYYYFTICWRAAPSSTELTLILFWLDSNLCYKYCPCSSPFYSNFQTFNKDGNLSVYSVPSQ